ncbi:MAG: hypothetical protein ACHQ9S_07575 [Candidatus Binatia bacterium]
MRYSVFLEPIQEAGFEGFYYAHIPTLDLTTHGAGVEGALAAARELAEAWVTEALQQWIAWRRTRTVSMQRHAACT